MKLIDYINQQYSIAGQSDDQTGYRSTINIIPEQIKNPKKGYGEPDLIWTGKYVARLGDIRAVDVTPEAAVIALYFRVRELPEPNLRDWERYYRTTPYEDTRSNHNGR